MAELKSDSGVGLAGIAAMIIVAGYLSLEVYGLYRNRDRMEPLQVFSQFAGAREAVASCDESPEGRSDYERNFSAVTRTALKDIGARQPDFTVEQIEQTLQAAREMREAEVAALVAEEGCEGRAVWRLRKLYEARSRLKLRY